MSMKIREFVLYYQCNRGYCSMYKYYTICYRGGEKKGIPCGNRHGFSTQTCYLPAKNGLQLIVVFINYSLFSISFDIVKCVHYMFIICSYIYQHTKVL